jgi:Mn-dependent DtxR family transcriptional regulator
VINATEFTDINQTAMSKDAGIALGSMTAALKKLTELGRIVSGPTGGYKLTPAPQSVVAAETAETPSV